MTGESTVRVVGGPHRRECSDVDEGEWIWGSRAQPRHSARILVDRKVARSSKNETSEDRDHRIRERRGAKQFEASSGMGERRTPVTSCVSRSRPDCFVGPDTRCQCARVLSVVFTQALYRGLQLLEANHDVSLPYPFVLPTQVITHLPNTLSPRSSSLDSSFHTVALSWRRKHLDQSACSFFTC